MGREFMVVKIIGKIHPRAAARISSDSLAAASTHFSVALSQTRLLNV
jgi:hypothetical protein